MLAKKCYFVGIYVLFSVSLVIAAPPAVHPVTGEDLVIDCLRGTVTIDGDLSDWNLEAMTPAVLDVAEQLFSGQDSWAAPEDCSGEFYLLWDDVNIYIAVVVKDDKLSMNKTGGDIWNADAVEVFFSTLNAVADHSEHYQYGFTASNQRWNWCNIDGAGSIEPEYLQIAATETADGYICEVSIEYAQMPSLDFSAGNTIGFHPVFDDTDNVDRELQMTWTGREAHDQSLGFGHMVLSADSVAEPEPVNPGAGNLVHSWTFDDGTADDVVGDAEGVLIGDAAVVDGQLVLDGDGDWMDMPGDVIAMNTFEGLTIEIMFTSVAGGNTGYHMVTAFGEEGTGDNPGYGYKYVCITPARGNDVSRGMIQTVSMDNDPWSEETGVSDVIEHDDGLPHHMVCTVDDTELAFYIDGVLIGTAALDPPGNSIAGLGTDVAHIGKGVYGVDPLWAGSVDYLNLYNRALSEQEVRYLAGERPMPVDPGTDGLAAFYPLENDVLDGSGNSNDGTIVGAPTFVDGLAGYGMAMEFDGESYVDVGNDVSLDVTGPISIALWIRPGADDPEGQGTEAAPLAKALSTGSPSWSWQVRYGWNSPQPYMAFTFNTSPRAWAYVGKNLERDEWAHIACSHDGTTLKCYLDGEQTDSTPMGAITSSPAPVLIGSDGWRSDWIGAIDEVAIYGRALSDGEVRYLAGFRAPEPEIDPSLVIYYDFDEVGDIVKDQSGKGHDGVVMGAVTAEADGKIGGAANFATGSYLDLDGPSIPAEDIPTSAMTLAAWINIANTGGDHEIFSARASDESWLIHPEPKSSGDIRWLLRSYGGTTIFQIRAGTVTWDQWLHFAGTYDKESGKAALYINGELIEEIVVENPADIAGDWDLGARVGKTIDDGRPFTGLMDEFRMYTRALSQDEILEVMQGM
ncbi:MAG: hypothetical protein H8D56_10680 [Planctomycetes bacterium]|nr:hypothetical protein [Planctomycetota bacterium]